MADSSHYRVAIIGAGFAGLGMAIRLKLAQRDDFILFERAAEIGGTWRDNIYPGCACDIPSIVYSFSFDQNPYWSRFYPTQPEILAYMKHCTEESNLHEHLRLNAEIVDARFDQVTGRWTLTDQIGRVVTADVVVAGLGPLNRPHIPALPGADTFKGVTFHSSTWDPLFNPAGKRIAVIGTGASAIQIVPELAKTAEQVTVFQRTAPWVMPRNDAPASEQRQRLFKQIPLLQKLFRGLRYWQIEIGVGNFLGVEWMSRIATKQALDHIQTSIQDPALIKAVTPNYQLGCKRVLKSDDYYPALTLPHVDLVDGGAQAITPEGVIGPDEVLHSVDAIVYCTGFVASRIDIDHKIIGLNDQNLFEDWKANGMEAYYGTSISGFPNFFFLLGPNTGLGHNSVLLMIESQYNYILDYLDWLDESGEAYFDVRPEAQAAHNRDIQTRLQSTVWQSGGCQSWYQQADGKNTTLWPGTTFGYRREMMRVHKSAYQKEPGSRYES